MELYHFSIFHLLPLLFGRPFRGAHLSIRTNANYSGTSRRWHPRGAGWHSREYPHGIMWIHGYSEKCTSSLKCRQIPTIHGRCQKPFIDAMYHLEQNITVFSRRKIERMFMQETLLYIKLCVLIICFRAFIDRPNHFVVLLGPHHSYASTSCDRDIMYLIVSLFLASSAAMRRLAHVLQSSSTLRTHEDWDDQGHKRFLKWHVSTGL